MPLFGDSRPKPAPAPGRDALFDDAFMAKLEYLEIVAKRAFAGSARGERRSKKLGAGLEFADYRRYSPGDDFRHVDWNVYQRLGKLLLRLYEEEEDLTVTLLIDASASMAVGDRKKLDHALRLAAALAYITLAGLDRVSIVSFSDTLGPRFLPVRGKAQIFKVMDFLRAIEPGGPTTMGRALETFVHQSKRRGLAVLLSDLYAQDGFEPGLNVLRYHKFEPLVLHVTDARELTPELRGDLQLVDCETGAVREVTVTPRLLDRYRRAHADWRGGVERFCTESQVGYFEASVQTPFEELVLGLFRAGGFLQMTFALMAPAELLALFAALAAAMVLLYVLKLRRRRVQVPFAPLWARLVEERQSTALFRRLRRLFSLLIQLAILALIVLAMGDPRLAPGTGCGFEPPAPPPERHTLVLLDSSASMATFERGRTRLERAAARAHALIDQLGPNPGHRLMLAAVDTDLRPLTLWSADRAAAHAAVDAWLAQGPRDTATDLAHALALAQDILRGRPNPETVLLSDTATPALPPALTAATALSVEPVGEPGANVGIEALNVRPYLDDSLTYSLFYAVRNTAARPLRATLYLYANEAGRGVADFVSPDRIVSSVALELPAQGVLRDVIGDLSFDGSRLCARVVIDPAEATADPFPTDDTAFALVPERRRLKVQLVGEANLFLQATLLVRENVDFELKAPADYRGPEGYDVTIVDRADVDISKPGRYLLVDPAPSDTFRVAGATTDPTVARVQKDHPLARGLVLADLGIQRATRYERDPTDRPVASAADGTPLLFTRRDAATDRTFAVLPFDLGQSLLPVNYAFPLLVVNVLNWFSPQPDGLIPTHRAGRPLSLAATLPEGPLTVAGPAGAPPAAARRTADRIALRADRIGIYELSTPSATAPMLVALNLMDADESAITPRGAYPAWTPPPPWTPPAPPWPGTLWRSLLIIALGVSLVEWLTWHRSLTL